MKMLARCLPMLALLLPMVAHAQMPGQHPAYLHALTDLRHARAPPEKPAKPSVMWDEAGAIGQIDAAINEIKKAAIDDGKPLNDHPPIDAGLDHGGRLRRALELLRSARRDIEQRETDEFAHGLRRRAFEHIDNAIRLTEAAISAKHH